MRYLPLTDTDRQKILGACGVKSFDDLVTQVPAELRLKGLVDLPPALSEIELDRHLSELADKNTAAKMACFLGQGVYDHSWPSVIDQITNRGEFLTAYTPYQPEISQGTLQVIFEFQSMIAELMAMDVSNASMYDGATALVEAILMAARTKGMKNGLVYLPEGLYPNTRLVLESYLKPLGFKFETWWANSKTFALEAKTLQIPSEPVVGLVMQSPNKWGVVEDWNELNTAAEALGTKSIAYVTHAMLPAVFAAPGEAGVDLVCGEAQTLGIPMGLGGPHLGILCCKKTDVRQMPGRLIGLTEDAKGQPAFCITLATREQHIRREKATSNICSNQNLMAVRSTLFLSLMGPRGLDRIVELSRSKATLAKKLLTASLAKSAPEIKILESTYLNEICLLVPQKHSLWIEDALLRCQNENLLAGCKVTVPGASGYVGGLTIAFTEKTTNESIEQLAQLLAGNE